MKEGIAHAIQYEGNNSTFIRSLQMTDFNIGSQQIVHESQEVVAFTMLRSWTAWNLDGIIGGHDA